MPKYNYVKRSDVTGNRLEWNSVKKKLYKTPPPYFIVLASSGTTMEVKAIEFHRICCFSIHIIKILHNVITVHL